MTGGAGFIGSNLVDALVARGDEVTVIDDLSTGRRENLDQALAAGARLVEADVRDAGAMGDLAGDAEPEAVFHLAAQIDVRRSRRSTRESTSRGRSRCWRPRRPRGPGAS